MEMLYSVEAYIQLDFGDQTVINRRSFTDAKNPMTSQLFEKWYKANVEAMKKKYEDEFGLALVDYKLVSKEYAEAHSFESHKIGVIDSTGYHEERHAKKGMS